METYHLQSDIKVFGRQVKTFPQGIGEVFDELVKMLGGFNRPYYGISYMAADGKMVYYATAIEKYTGEAEKYNCERFTIGKGEYLTIKVEDWRKKTATIGDIFHELVKDDRTDKTTPAIEWYKNDDEMLCMIKTIKR